MRMKIYASPIAVSFLSFLSQLSQMKMDLGTYFHSELNCVLWELNCVLWENIAACPSEHCYPSCALYNIYKIVKGFPCS